MSASKKEWQREGRSFPITEREHVAYLEYYKHRKKNPVFLRPSEVQIVEDIEQIRGKIVAVLRFSVGYLAAVKGLQFVDINFPIPYFGVDPEKTPKSFVPTGTLRFHRKKGTRTIQVFYIGADASRRAVSKNLLNGGVHRLKPIEVIKVWQSFVHIVNALCYICDPLSEALDELSTAARMIPRSNDPYADRY